MADAKKRPPLVRVIWEDVHCSDETAWVDNKAHAYQAKVAESVGYLLHKDKRGVVLTGAWFQDGSLVGQRDHIPMGMIRKIERIRG